MALGIFHLIWAINFYMIHLYGYMAFTCVWNFKFKLYFVLYKPGLCIYTEFILNATGGSSQ